MQGFGWYSCVVNYVQLLLPDFSLILCGYLVCRYTALRRPLWEQVETLVYFFLFPVLLFQSIVKSPLDVHAASLLMGAGWALGLSGIAMAYALPHVPILKRWQLIAVLIGVCVPLFNVAAVWPMVRHARRNLARELLRNPLIIATASALVANLLGFSIPPWLEPSVTRIGAASLALGLMAAGAGMQLGALNRAKALGVAVLAIRHLMLPLVAMVIARLFGLSVVEATILLVFSALPTSSSCYVLATRMGYDGAYVAGLVTLSTVLAMVSLPMALGLLR